MNVIQAFEGVKASLAELERVIQAFDLTPQVIELDTRIKAMTGILVAKIEPPPEV